MSDVKTGKRNLITDVKGINVGNAHDEKLKSGTTVLLTQKPAICSYHVSGGAPGTKETDLLKVENTVQEINAITLSGGSSFGLDAASGAQAFLREKNIGFEVGDQVVPIIPAAIIFDLLNGGDKDWGKYAPYRELGYEAAQKASEKNSAFDLGSIGAGFGALTANLKGGLGSASTVLENGTTIGALVVVNALGSTTMGNSSNFWASPFEINNEFGSLGLPKTLPKDTAKVITKYHTRSNEQIKANTNTTIAIIATDAKLTKAEAKRFAMSAHDGFARAIWPAHTPMDGDLVFALSTAQKQAPQNTNEWIDLCAYGASTMSRAIARAIYEAKPYENDIAPCWKDTFGT